MLHSALRKYGNGDFSDDDNEEDGLDVLGDSLSALVFETNNMVANTTVGDGLEKALCLGVDNGLGWLFREQPFRHPLYTFPPFKMGPMSASTRWRTPLRSCGRPSAPWRPARKGYSAACAGWTVVSANESMMPILIPYKGENPLEY